MKKTLLYIAVFAVILVPSITFAAWYNPLTWFKKSPTSVVVPSTATVEAPQTTTQTPVVLPVPQPVVTQTITVTDPKLQAQINTLEQQNTALQTQLVSLTTKYNALVTENTSLKAQISSSSQVTPAQASVVNAPNQLIVSYNGYSQGYMSVGYYEISLKNDSENPVKITALGIPDNIKTKITTTLYPYISSDLSGINSPVNPIIIPSQGSIEVYIYADSGTVPEITSILTDRSINFAGLPFKNEHIIYMNKSVTKAVWVLIIFIILATSIVLIRISNEDDQTKEQAQVDAITAQQKNDTAYTDCMKKADNEYIDAQISYCEDLGYSQMVCNYSTDLPDLSLGKAGDDERAEEQMCQNQYPGAIYQNN